MGFIDLDFVGGSEIIVAGGKTRINQEQGFPLTAMKMLLVCFKNRIKTNNN